MKASPSSNKALEACDRITLRLSRWPAVADMVSYLAGQADETSGDSTVMNGIESAADLLMAEIEQLSHDVSELYELSLMEKKGGAR